MKLNFSKLGGLIPAVIQDVDTKDVLMVGFMNEESLARTIKDKKVTFWSRTRKKIWQKGETSGNFLDVISITPDCDNDTVLILVNPKGPTCHKGTVSCFNLNITFLEELYGVIENRFVNMPKKSYTASLFKSGLDKIAQKVGEEAIEVVIAAKNKSKKRTIEEVSDLLYHLVVLLVAKGISLEEIIRELKKR
jgi:phosphoribosyl-ATP pyrophosphohydrolase/phosphoribosyl-AMP cyclohydrolase